MSDEYKQYSIRKPSDLKRDTRKELKSVRITSAEPDAKGMLYFYEYNDSKYYYVKHESWGSYYYDDYDKAKKGFYSLKHKLESFR